MGRQQHRFHGDERRFAALADFVYERYGRRIHYIADVAGGQGLLSRVLAKKYNYACEVIDPRGNALPGVPARASEFDASMAGFYDLVLGLHPDEATRPVAMAALVRPTIIIPCCNFWDTGVKLGRDALLDALGAFYREKGVRAERVTFDFDGPKNIGYVTEPPRGASRV